MINYREVGLGSVVTLLGLSLGQVPAQAQPLYLAYPPPNHQTTSQQIFFIGSAAPNLAVTLNGQPVQRSHQGNFAPVLPLAIGENRFIFQAGDQRLERTIIRLATTPTLPPDGGFAPDSLFPNQAISRPGDEPICFTAHRVADLSEIAPPHGSVSVSLAGQTIPLTPQAKSVQLPANNSLLYGQNQPTDTISHRYIGCQTFQNATSSPLPLGTPQFTLQWQGKTWTEMGKGTVTVLAKDRPQVVAVTANPGVARTGPSTDYSRLTPLPQGTLAAVTGSDGDWLRLDYGGWIKAAETQTLASQTPPRSVIRSVGYQAFADRTEMRFPLQLPVPVTVQQNGDRLTLTLYNTTAQTDTIRIDPDPIIKGFTWQQSHPDRLEYQFHFKTEQQWGYDLRYEETTLVLTLRHPPQIPAKPGDLRGVKILIDPGHGGKESGAVGPTGYPEKAINLLISRQLAAILRSKGADVHLTRTSDEFVSLSDRVAQMEQVQPAIALSIHYNALPDSGDPNTKQGISAFWYQPQSQQLANALQQSLVQTLNRTDDGVYFNSLAVIRPAIAPAVLLELGYMINPQEFEWITDSSSQTELVKGLADGVTAWLHQQR
ncbi:MAG: N-acetylmuramoyl-L-alanine amidase [Cyanobacteriota bacterium]|jgi:N-acetylmuramoyl-L-alanine amidase